MHPYFARHSLRPPLIRDAPASDCFIRIVIPVHKESHLIDCLISLADCHQPAGTVEVILLFNAAAEDVEGQSINQKTKAECDSWYKLYRPFYKLYMLEENALDPKHAGVGLARKLGMDEAARRFYAQRKENGIIVCLDADCTVARNYLLIIGEHFIDPNSKSAASIYFEHPLEGDRFDPDVYHAIQCYELHLRYYKHAIEYTGLPFGRYTVGSSMAVKAQAYLAEGGMSKRKAGEDFYFLQKYLIKADLDEIKKTAVYPSPRISERVPFGTGRAVKDHLIRRKDLNYTYSCDSFKVLAALMDSLHDNYPNTPRIPSELIEFMGAQAWEKAWNDMLAQSHNLSSFNKRFYQWFTPFRVLKLLHYLRDHHFPHMPIEKAVADLLKTNSTTVYSQLVELRKQDQF